MSRTFLCADLFCGAGGTSTGAARALRRAGHALELVAVNHWDKAIATHSRNHPRARHYCVNLDTSNPEEIVPEGYLDLLMASPECVHHSRARGGKPVSDQRRADAWLVNRWLTRLDVSAILIENVPEFLEWGPTCSLPAGHAGPHREDGRAPIAERCAKPVPERKRVYFEAWVRSLWELGYVVEWRILNAADYGDATTRKRFFLIARKDGIPVRWPQATHSRDGSGDLFGGLKRWRSAREIIDWDHPGQSLFERRKPLSLKTRLRIARGLQKYGGELAGDFIDLLDLPPVERALFPVQPIGTSPEPFILLQRDSSLADGSVTPSRARAASEPLPTVTGQAVIRLVDPAAEPFHFGNRENNAARSPDEPIAGATSAHGGGIAAIHPDAQPFVMEGAHTHQAGPGVRSADEPLTTIGAHPRKIVVEPLILGQGGGGEIRTADEPLPTIATDGAIARIDAHVSPYYGNGQASPIDAPVPTVTGRDRHALVEPTADALTIPYGPKAEARSADEPLHTIPTRDRLGVAEATAEPFIYANRNNSAPRPTSEPAPTVTGANYGIGFVEPTADPFLLGRQGHSDPSGRTRSIDDPLPTVVASETGKPYLMEPQAEPFVLGRSSTPTSRPVEEPLPTATGSGSGYLVDPEAEPFLLSRQGRNDPRGRVRSADEPLGAVTASDAGTPYLVAPFLTPNFGEDNRGPGQPPRVHDIDGPVPAVTSRGGGNLVEPVIVQTDQTGGNGDYVRDPDQPLPTMTTKSVLGIAVGTVEATSDVLWGVDSRRLRVIRGQVYLLDIKFRMLKNRELARAMSFDDDGRYDFVGTQAEITMQIGNAVPCRTAEALVKAILLESGAALAGAAS